MNKQEVIDHIREAAEKQLILIQSIPKEYFEKEIEFYTTKPFLKNVSSVSDMKKQLRPLISALGSYKIGVYYVTGSRIAVKHHFANGAETVSFIPKSELGELTGGKCTIQPQTITSDEVVCEIGD